MRRSARPLVLLLAVLLVAGTAPLASAAPTPTTTGIFLDGERNEWVSGGHRWFIAPPTYTFAATADPAGSFLQILITGPQPWRIAVDAPAGQVLEAGRTYDTTIGVASPGVALMYVDGDGRGCPRADGSVTITELSIGPDGSLDHLDLDFWNRCDDGRDAKLFGSVRVAAARGIQALDAGPDRIDWGRVTVDSPATPREIAMTNTGNLPIALSSKAIVGPHASDFALMDGCGPSLEIAESCTMTLGLTPSARGPRGAALVISDGTLRGTRSFELLAEAWQTTSVSLEILPSMWGDAGMRLVSVVTPNPGGGGIDYRWTAGGEEQTTSTQVDAATATADVDLQTFPGTWELTATFRESDFFASSTVGPVTKEILPVGPVGQVLIADEAPSTHDPVVQLELSFLETFPAAIGLRLSNDATSWVERPFDLHQSWTLPAGDGVHSVYAQGFGANGSWGPVAVDTIVLDTVAPSTTTPSGTVLKGGALANGRVPFRLSWTGSDASSGIDHYEIGQSLDNGTWAIVTSGQTVPTTDRLLLPGHTYRFRVRAIDRASSVGAWSTGMAYRLTGYSEAGSAVRYSGTWASNTSTAYWGGKARSSIRAGSKATFTFTGRSVAIVSRLGPGRGKADVWMGTTRLATIDLGSTAYSSQRIVWSKAWTTSATRTVTIKVLGTSGRPRVEVDGFIVGS